VKINRALEKEAPDLQLQNAYYLSGASGESKTIARALPAGFVRQRLEELGLATIRDKIKELEMSWDANYGDKGGEIVEGVEVVAAELRKLGVIVRPPT